MEGGVEGHEKTLEKAKYHVDVNHHSTFLVGWLWEGGLFWGISSDDSVMISPNPPSLLSLLEDLVTVFIYLSDGDEGRCNAGHLSEQQRLCL